MSTLTENPFRTAPGSDPPHLVGRNLELDGVRFALGMTASGASATPVVITGLRGMGKTVLRRDDDDPATHHRQRDENVSVRHDRQLLRERRYDGNR